MNHNKNTLSRSIYNLVIGAVVLYGLIVNVILCALIPDVTAYINPILFYVLYFICAISGIAISKVSNNPLFSFIGYNLVVVPVGLVVSMSINYYGGLDSSIVLTAFAYTAGITGLMVVASVIWPKFFESIGKFLFIALVAILIVSIVELFIGHFTITSWIAAVVFSLYIGYDIVNAQLMNPTLDNAVDAAVGIYLDIINLLLRVLEIVAKSKDD